MATKAELILERRDALASLKAIDAQAEKDNRPLTDEERKSHAELTESVKGLTVSIDKLEADDQRRIEIADIEAQIAKSARKTAAKEPTTRIEHSGELQPWETIALHGSLSAFRGPHAKRNAYLSGQWLLSRMSPYGSPVHERATKICRNYGINTHEERALSETTSAGYLVPSPLSSTIIELREQYGVFRQNARIYPMSSDSETIPRYASGATAYYVGEGDSITDSTPAFTQVTLTARKLAALVKMSSEVSEDAVMSLADWCARDMALQFAQKEDDAGFNGTGAASYGGISGILPKIYADSATVGALDCAAGHDSLDEVDVDDLAIAVAKLPQYARANAKWYASATADAVIFGALSMAGGGNTVTDLGQGPTRSFWGFPIVISQVMPSSLTATAYNNLVMILLGDLTMSSTLGSRRDIRIEVLTERYAEYDQIAIKGTERFDIVNHNVGDGTNAGPVIGLVGQT